MSLYFKEIDDGNMDEDFLYSLDHARELAGIPFVITSAYRTVENELSNGRDGTSSHTKGLAVDIRVRSSSERYTILNALICVGFNRIGIGQNFIHVDQDPDKVSNVIWTYKNK